MTPWGDHAAECLKLCMDLSYSGDGFILQNSGDAMQSHRL